MVKENIGFKVSFFTNLLWVIGRLKLEEVIEKEEMNESIHMALEFFNQALYTEAAIKEFKDLLVTNYVWALHALDI